MLLFIAEECEYSVFGPSDIASPEYPNPYDANMDCLWKLSVDKGKRIKLTIIDIDIEYSSECQFDSLRVYDGRNRRSPSLATICGEDFNKTIVSTGKLNALN